MCYLEVRFQYILKSTTFITLLTPTIIKTQFFLFIMEIFLLKKLLKYLFCHAMKYVH